jgi:molybdopterin adenylyltransferase
MQVAILTVSDRGSRGERIDTAGPAVAALIEGAGGFVGDRGVVADEFDLIAARLREWCDSGAYDLVLTTGGTGLAPRDVTPEATLAVAQRLVPGIAEVMREEGRKNTPLAALSRSVVATRGRTLIVNLPGSERGARESLQAVLHLLPHAVELLRGDAGERHPV